MAVMARLDVFCPRALLVFLLLIAAVASAQAPPDSLSIRTTPLPKATLRQRYVATFRAEQGTPPLLWQVESGDLPPGIALDTASGRLAGVPKQAGEFHFTVKVSDAAEPPQAALREFVLKVIAPLTLEWRVVPRVEGDNAIRGSVRITNGTEDDFDLTFIAVAVNQVGKAFALGYQRFTLSRESSSPQLDLGSTLPAGEYIVHVDAVAEVPSRNAIYRARLQTSVALTLPGLP